MFVRRESFQQFIHRYPIVTWIVGINLVLFLLSWLAPAIYAPIRYWGIGWNAAVEAGQYWRLITPIFLHGGIGHLIFNCFALIIFGPPLEVMLGRLKFIALYLFAGFLGNVGTFLFEIGHYFHLGASGSIYGLMGIYLYMRFYRKDLIDHSSAQTVTILLVIGIIYSLISPNINILGHLFGFIGGAALGPVFLRSKMKYFSMPTDSGYSGHSSSEEIGFDPQRWQKARKRKQIIKYALIGLFILFVLIGILNHFLT